MQREAAQSQIELDEATRARRQQDSATRETALKVSFKEACEDMPARMVPYFREMNAKRLALDAEIATAERLAGESRELNVKLEAALGAYLRADAATRKAAKRAKTERPEPPTTAAPATSATNRPATFAQALNISSASIQQQATQQLQQQQSMQAGGHFYEANSPATGRRLGGW